MSMSRKEWRFQLYKAVKWQVTYFFGDHGMTLVEMWNKVNSKDENAAWWYNECMEDYMTGYGYTW